MGDYLGQRGGKWYYIRRVPTEFAELDPRGIVRISTRISVAGDPRGSKAGRIAERHNSDTEAYWRGLVDGQAAEARRRYEAARKRARALGFDYVPAEDLAVGDRAELLARLRAANLGASEENEPTVAGVLGGEAPPTVMLSRLVEEYEALEKAQLVGMSEDQVQMAQSEEARAGQPDHGDRRQADRPHLAHRRARLPRMVGGPCRLRGPAGGNG